jgi:hypothetical protein
LKRKFITGQNEREESTQNTIVTKMLRVRAIRARMIKASTYKITLADLRLSQSESESEKKMIGRTVVLLGVSMAGLLSGASVVHQIMKPDLTLPKTA